MKQLSFSLILLSVMLFSTCKKDDPCTTGSVRFTNTSTNPYDLYVDDQFQIRISGNTFTELDFPEGQIRVRVEQVSGFILFPTMKEGRISVFGCQENEWVFP